jgi:hypothetical protein
VQRRAATLPGYYRQELAKYDRRFHGTVGAEAGPLVQLLQSYGKLEGLVVGPWGNGSKDLHDLVRTVAECRVAAQARTRGWPGSDWELGEVMGKVRSDLSLDFVRANALCVLARIGQVGGGARAAAQRRDQAGRDEEARKRERMAHYLAHVRGRGVYRAVFGPGVEQLLEGRRHGLFLRMLEKMYEKAWQEGLPAGWPGAMEAAGRLAVDRTGGAANPVGSLAAGGEGSRGGPGEPCTALPAWGEWTVRVVAAWQKGANIGVSVHKVREGGPAQYDKLQLALEGHYGGSQGDGEELAARGSPARPGEPREEPEGRVRHRAAEDQDRAVRGLELQGAGGGHP